MDEWRRIGVNEAGCVCLKCGSTAAHRHRFSEEVKEARSLARLNEILLADGYSLEADSEYGYWLVRESATRVRVRRPRCWFDGEVS